MKRFDIEPIDETRLYFYVWTTSHEFRGHDLNLLVRYAVEDTDEEILNVGRVG